MRVLITGASGIIGQSLLEMLQKYASEIDATFNTRRLQNIDIEKINLIHYKEIFNNKNLKKYDQIWHFATYGQPAKFIESWKEIVKLNIHDLNYLIELLADNGHFYYASTSELYGDQKSDESTIPSSDTLSKRAVYTESKRLGEAILNTAIGDRATFFRICLAYSPNFFIGDNRVLYELILKGLKNDSINLLDDGNSQRQYIYIDDAINMMERIAFTNFKEDSIRNAIWNISNPHKITILELAETIGDILNKPVKPGLKNFNPFHALSKVEINPKRYFDTFGEYKFTPIDYGIKKVIKSAKKQIDIL